MESDSDIKEEPARYNCDDGLYNMDICFEHSFEPQFFFVSKDPITYFHNDYNIIIHNKIIFVEDMETSKKIDVWQCGRTKFYRTIKEAIREYKKYH
jgi:hypothetical protein